MKVLFLMNSPSPDRTPYLNGLAELGLDLEVIYVPIGPDDHGWGEFELRHPHRCASSSTQAAILAVEALTGGEVDILISFGYRTLPYAAALITARMKRIHTVVRSDTNIDAIHAEPTWKRSARRAVAGVLIPRRAVAWTIGSKNSEFWRDEIGLSNEVLIPYEVLQLPGGANPARRTRDPEDTLRILYAGRLIPVKRVQDLLAAVLSLPVDLSWELRVVGDGPERPPLEAMAHGDPRIQFVGAVAHDRLGEHFAQADVFVLPSGHEAWGLVVNEALGFGLYTIATDAVGAAHDQIWDGVNGEVVPVGDVASLRQALSRSAGVTSHQPTPPHTDTTGLILDSIRAIRKSSLNHDSSKGPGHRLKRMSTKDRLLKALNYPGRHLPTAERDE